MLDKLNIVQQRFNEVSDLIIQPDIITDQKRYIKLNKEYKELGLIIEKKVIYERLISNKNEAEEISRNESDKEMLEMANDELKDLKEKINIIEEDIKFLLIPKDPDDSKNVVIELRAGTGGDEASIFAGDLFRMYTKYCEGRKWNVSLVDTSPGTSGGYKEIIFEVSGNSLGFF